MVSRSILLIMGNVSDKRCKENRNTHFMFNNVFLKIVPFMRYVEKHDTARQYNMVHVHCMRDNKSYKHKLRICNNYFSSTATFVT
jgi:hypothetical protein